MERRLLTAAYVFERHSPRLVALLALATSSLCSPAVLADPVTAGSEIETIRSKANRALADGHFASAHVLYREVLARDPGDPAALREGGRAAHALQNFASAVTLLQKADALVAKPDPELHYLLGEALWMQGRKSEARAAYSIARREIGAAPTDRLPRLWLARIHDRSGNQAAACATYDAMAAIAPSDEEVALTHAEMHARAREWSRAEETLRSFIAVQHGHRRALEMLAWITEARGDLRSEIALREVLARDSTTAGPVRDYGRALERSGNWSRALAMYRKARGLSSGSNDLTLERALQRLEQRMAAEIAGGVTAKSDTGGNAIGGAVGIAVPFGRAHHFVVSAWRELVANGSREGSTGELAGALAMTGVATTMNAGIKLGIVDFTSRTDAMWSRTATEPAAFVSLRRTLLAGHVELGVDAEVNTVWREAVLVELEGGSVDAVTARGWANAVDRRLVIDTGAQLRRLRFMKEGMGDPRASQVRAWAGADWQLWGDASKQAVGEILDDDLLRPTFLANAVVASYRHHEVFADANPAFMERLTLADRSSIDELSLALRLAMRDGRIALDTHGGLSYDRAREIWIASGNVALWTATGRSSRLSFTFEIATETDFAINGTRLSGGTTYHVDL